MNNVLNVMKKKKNALVNKAVLVAGSLQLALLSGASHAQDEFNMPTVAVPGADEGGDPVALAFAIFKWIALGAVWIFIILAGLSLLKNILKSVNKVRRDEEAKWTEVIGDIVGNAVVVVAIIAFGSWLTPYLA